jgi:hypothetical protein
MALSPLTHHEILALVAPFTRHGRHVDLAASNRSERLIVFQPREHFVADGVLRETLQLHSFGTGTCQLTRVLTRACGLQAKLQAMGPEAAKLLAEVEAVLPDRQFQDGPGFAIARSYSLEGAPQGLILTSGEVRTSELTLSMTVSPVRRVAAELTLTASGTANLALPEDLLAVLGWDWARLVPGKPGWKTKLRLRGAAPARTRKAELALERAAAHLARTLAEAPHCFHDRLLAARWGVVLRRAIPLLTFVFLLIAVASLARRGVGRGSELWVLFFRVPTALIALSFCLQELPQYEIPPLPRRMAMPSWRQDPIHELSEPAYRTTP